VRQDLARQPGSRTRASPCPAWVSAWPRTQPRSAQLPPPSRTCAG